LGTGLTLQLRDDDPVIEVNVAGGRASLLIARDGAVTVESQGSIELKGVEITIQAQGQLNLKGGTVNIN
jgi:hypothetical protein